MTTESRPVSPAGPYAGFYPVIAPLVMCSGLGDGKNTACVMAQAATIDALRKGKTLDAPTDKMECACPVLRRMAINANDAAWWASDAERTEVLRPLIPLLLDSAGSPELTARRIFRNVDAQCRELIPQMMELIDAKHYAEGIALLRGLTPITDKASAGKAAADIRASDLLDRLDLLNRLNRLDRLDLLNRLDRLDLLDLLNRLNRLDRLDLLDRLNLLDLLDLLDRQVLRSSYLALFRELAAMKEAP